MKYRSRLVEKVIPHVSFPSGDLTTDQGNKPKRNQTVPDVNADEEDVEEGGPGSGIKGHKGNAEQGTDHAGAAKWHDSKVAHHEKEGSSMAKELIAAHKAAGDAHRTAASSSSPEATNAAHAASKTAHEGDAELAWARAAEKRQEKYSTNRWRGGW